jgi:membrane protein DedA with SNARE-associated domain
LTEQLVEQLGYLGIALILILGGLGLPIPEEAPIILAAVLARNGQLWWPVALASCLGGVLLGDLVVYFLGYFNGEKVLKLPVTRRLLTRQREAQIKGYFHRHGFKILVSGRFVPGFRTAAYLTAGILKLPVLKLLVTDIVAASLSTLVMFGLGFAFAYQIQQGIREAQQVLTLVAALGIGALLFYRYYKARRRAGLPVGPAVLDIDEDPLSPEPPRVPPAPSHDPHARVSTDPMARTEAPQTASQPIAADSMSRAARLAEVSSVGVQRGPVVSRAHDSDGLQIEATESARPVDSPAR